MYKVIASALFGIFLVVSLFGLPLLLSHSDHHHGCPLSAASAVMCERTILEHFSMWQAMFVAVTTTLALFAVAPLVALFRAPLPALRTFRTMRRTQSAQLRPTLLQELYARGIHNRRESYC